MNALDLKNEGLRLRYEAFSKLASEVNKAKDLEQLGKVIANNLKFIVDSFIALTLFIYPNDRIGYRIFRGQSSLLPDDETQPASDPAYG